MAWQDCWLFTPQGLYTQNGQPTCPWKSFPESSPGLSSRQWATCLLWMPSSLWKPQSSLGHLLIMCLGVPVQAEGSWLGKAKTGPASSLDWTRAVWVCLSVARTMTATCSPVSAPAPGPLGQCPCPCPLPMVAGATVCGPYSPASWAVACGGGLGLHQSQSPCRGPAACAPSAQARLSVSLLRLPPPRPPSPLL